MSASETADVVRRVYEAYGAMDLAAIDGLMATGFVLHVGGHHPLSGDHLTRDDVWAYLAKVAEVSGGQGGWDVHAVTADDDGHGVALLTGTIREFVRPAVHIWHVHDGQATEFWDAYPDGRAEDAFWTAALAG